MCLLRLKWNLLILRDIILNKKSKFKDSNRQNFTQKEFYFSGNFYIAKIDYLKKIKTFVGKNTYYFPVKSSSQPLDDIKDFKANHVFKKKII